MEGGGGGGRGVGGGGGGGGVKGGGGFAWSEGNIAISLLPPPPLRDAANHFSNVRPKLFFSGKGGGGFEYFFLKVVLYER